MILERPTFLDPDRMAFGVVTEPKPNELRRRGVILLNAGATRHIGASRMYVSLARRWARCGYYVLRLDLAGIGDGRTRADCSADDVFPPRALDDIRAGISYLRDAYGVTEVTVGGLCSGAYHALRAAVTALPVSRIFMINPQNFFWTHGTPLEDVQLADVVHNPGVYREKILSWTAWKRLIKGEVDLTRIGTIYARRVLLTLESALRALARQIGWRLRSDLGWELEELAARGVQMVFVFARGEPGIDLLNLNGGYALKHIGDRCRIHIIDGADHTFSHNGPRFRMEEILSKELYARLEPATGIVSGLVSNKVAIH